LRESLNRAKFGDITVGDWWMQLGRDELHRRLAALDKAMVMLCAEYPGHEELRAAHRQ